MLSEYTGIAWKNHVASDFEEGLSPTHPNGAGKGGTIFFDYEFMVSYLKKNGKEWYAAELLLDKTPINYEFGDNRMATILENLQSKEGFKPINTK